MTLKDIVRALHLTVKTGEQWLDREVRGGYAGDMLSDVLAHAEAGQVWVTLQTHLNIVAVASTKELAGIIIVHGRTPEEETVNKAEQERIPLLISNDDTFTVICRLYECGIR